MENSEIKPRRPILKFNQSRNSSPEKSEQQSVINSENASESNLELRPTLDFMRKASKFEDHGDIKKTHSNEKPLDPIPLPDFENMNISHFLLNTFLSDTIIINQETDKEY